MCGLFAWWPKDRDDKNKILSARALEALKPRGPDDSHLYFDPSNALLGHCRLKITGDNGEQPLISEDGTIFALVNGQFYDYKKYKNQLIKKGYKFKTQTDSEILIGLYQEYGFDCLKFLEGEFAFVLWDKKKNLIWACRDRGGVKPLRFSLKDGLAFSSESKGFLAAGWVGKWNEIALAQALSVQYIHPRLTLFADIYQVAPGESIVFQHKSEPDGRGDESIVFQHKNELDGRDDESKKDKQLNQDNNIIFTPNLYNDVLDKSQVDKSNWKISSYNYFRWFPHNEDSLIKLSNFEADEQLEYYLTKSVKKRVEDNSWSSAIHLSGGCDSSAILTLACQYASSNIKAYCVEFENDNGDIEHNESQLARKTAKKIGVDFQSVKANRLDILTHWSQAIERAEGLAINGHLVAKWLLSRQINADGHRISLSGEGADEALLGYSFLAMERVDNKDKKNIDNIKKSNLVSIGSMLPDKEQLELDKMLNSSWSHIPIWLQAKASIGYKLRLLMKDEWQKDIVPKALKCWDNPVSSQNISNQHILHHTISSWANLSLGGYILPALADAPETGFQIQGRTPFLDGQLLDQVMRWDVTNTYYDKSAKAPLRSFLRKNALEDVANKNKHPFEAPPILGDDTCVSFIKEQWLDPSVWENTPFDYKKIKDFIKSWDNFKPSDRQRYEPVIASLLSVQHLSSLFINE